MPIYLSAILWAVYLLVTYLLVGAVTGPGAWHWIVWIVAGLAPVLLYHNYLKWAFWGVFWVLLLSMLHYTLPQRDIVYITGTSNRIIQFGENSIFWGSPDVGTNEEAGTVQRDVLFIDTVMRNGRVMVYRNEDTGWIWPPYFKYISSNVQAQARNFISTEANPRWVAVRHYGWRVPFLSVFPNAVAIREVDGPDTRLIPVFNIIFLTVLAAIIWAVWVRWRRFKAQRIDPAIAGVDAAFDERRAGLSRWINSWRSKPRR